MHLVAAHTVHAWAYARALGASPNATLVGVFDPEPFTSADPPGFHGAPFHADAERRVAGGAAVVCSARVEHRRYVEVAAALGYHVLCEKPIATTLADAEPWWRCATGRGCSSTSRSSHGSSPLSRARGRTRWRLGDLFGVVGGNRGRPPFPPWYPSWITDPLKAGGGALIDHSVHLTDVIHH